MVAGPDDRTTVRDPLAERFEAERPGASIERKQALADLEHALFGRPRRVITVSRYVLLKRIAAGGGGVVYSAYDPELDRKVAIKLIRTHGAAAGDSSDAAARLTREARAAAKLSHPNVVTVHDVGIYDPAALGVVAGSDDEELTSAIERDLPSTGVFVVMEFIDGRSLAVWAADRERDWTQILSVYLQAGEGLAAAHASGLVHRDFKPSNVMIGDDGRVRVLDFGLARVHGEQEEAPRAEGMPEGELDRTIDRPLTLEGAVVGTPMYMPPEQHAGETADARSDQYSFCVSLYESLMGKLPFEGEDLETLANSKQTDRPAPVDEKRVPAWVAQTLRRGLRARPEDRFGSMRELLDALGHNPAESRLRLGIGVALVGLVGGLLGVLLAGGGPEPVCPDPAAPLAGIWDDARRGELSAAFASSGKAYADSTWATVEASIDDYAERWTAARREACEATLIRQERSPELMGAQMLCLDERLNRLAELTRLLATGDAQVIETATEGVAMLGPLEPCADPALAGTNLQPPIALRDEVMKVDAELARAEALRRAGKLAEAAEVADAALGSALEIAHPPLQAHAYLALGQVRSTMKENRAAEENLRKALLIAESAGDNETAVRALINLGLVVGYQQKRHGEGEQALALARAKLGRHNPGPAVEAMLERNVGLLLLDQRRFDDAFVPLDRARILLADAYGEDSVQVTTALNALALLAASKNEFAAAMDYYERSSAVLSNALGPRHPTVAGLKLNIGVIALERGDWAKAEKWQREGLSILRESVGDDHPFVAQALSNLAASLVGLGEIEEALELQREALKIKRARLDPDDPSIAVSLNNLGAALNLAGRDEEALKLHEEALELRSRTLGVDHLEATLSLTNIGLSQLALGEPARARDTLQRAVEGIEAELGPTSGKLVEPLRGLGEAYLELGRREQARPLLERAESLRDEAGVDPIQAADVAFALARLLEHEDADAARAHAERAAEAYRRLGHENPRTQRIEAWLREH